MIPETHLVPIWCRIRYVLLVVVWICVVSRSNAITQESVKTSAVDKPVALKVYEIGKVSNREFARKWKRENWAFSDWLIQLYIINYGNNKDVALREKVIADSIAFRHFDRIRITLVRGGLVDGPKTVVWKIPPGAEYPKP